MGNEIYLKGYPLMPIDGSKLEEYISDAIAKGVSYGYGSKDPVLGAWPIDYDHIDCSGFIRTMLYFATNGHVKLPDGSYIQNQWCRSQGYKESTFGACSNNDNIVRLCFHRPNAQDSIGHVWICLNGKTYESYGGHGPGHRHWDTLILHKLVTDVYAVAFLGPKNG